MKKFKIKEMFIGVTINLAGLGQIKVKSEHADIFARRKMYAYLEDAAPVKKLVAKKPNGKKKVDATFESK
jgi:hypothetical protein